MINNISLQQCLPTVFAHNQNNIVSDVWLQDISFEKGKTYLIEAGSGTGKSSLCNFIYGWRKDYNGTICFNDCDVKNYSESEWVQARQKSISIMFQGLRLFPELTAIENVELNNSLTKHKSSSEIAALFNHIGISDKINQKIKLLSFGQQQRVAFIRALCQPFDFIILDEPISHLDSQNESILSNILLNEAFKQGAGIIITSIGKALNIPYNQKLIL